MIEAMAVLNHLPRKQRDPLHVLGVLARRKGDVFAYTTGQPPSFLANRPEFVRHVLVDAAARYSKDTPINAGFRDTIATGLLSSEGQRWQQQRTLMQPAFARRYTPWLARIVERELQRAIEDWTQPDGSIAIEVLAETTRLLFRITSIVLFNVDPRPWDGRLTDILAAALPALADEDERAFRISQHAIRDIGERIVAARNQQSRPHDDLLGRLIASGSAEAEPEMLRDHVVPLALSGYETTASVVTWGLLLLATHPDIAATIRVDIDSATQGHLLGLRDLAHLPSLQAAVKETMRLFPPAWIIGRRALQPDRIGDVDIPVGGVVAISPYTLHRHPRYWPDPDAFNPARFGSNQERDRPPFTYIPFGAGPRTCVGTTFAQVEAPLIIGRLLQQFELHIEEGAGVVPRGLFVIVPDQPIRLRCTARSDKLRLSAADAAVDSNA